MQLEEYTWYYIQGSDEWPLETKELITEELKTHGFEKSGLVTESGVILIRVEDGDLSVMCDSIMDRDTPLDLEV